MSETHVVIGAGPLGRAVADQLHRTDQSVRLVNRSVPASIPDTVEFHKADVRDEEQAVAACAGATGVYDCVGLPYAEWSREFPAITEGVLRGTEASGARVVVADNLYAYGPVDGPITERHPDEATDTKGQIRADRAKTYLENGEVPVTIGRASNFFGPGVIDTAPLVDPFGAALRSESISALGDLTVPHSFCYLPNFADALVTLGDSDRALGEVWHVPHPETVTTGEFLERIFEAAGTEYSVRTAPWFIEALLGVLNAEVRELQAIRYQFTKPFVVDDSKFIDAFGVSPTSLDEAIRNTLSWHRKRDA
jgi:nucleoside-diphosphate-sugar epimerase